MTWQAFVVLRIIVASIFGPILLKQLTSAPSRTRNIVWQYVFTAALAGLAAVATNSIVFSWSVAAVAGLGFLSAFAGYCHWRAVDISLSKTVLFIPAGDLWAMFLGFVFLRESKHLNPLLLSGLALTLGSVALFSIPRIKAAWRGETASEKNKTERWIWFCLVLAVMVWGSSSFLTRYVVLNALSPWTFMVFWYGGSVFGSFLVFALAGKKEAGEPLNRRQILWVLPRSAVMWLSMVLGSWTLKYAPLTVIQPIFLASSIVCSTILGLWFFKEIKQLSAWEKAATALGVIGGLIIALSFKQT